MTATHARRSAVAWAIWLVALAIFGWRLVRSHSATLFGLDFSQMHDAVLNLIHRGDPYIAQPTHLGFVYPPSSAVAFLPLGALPQTWSVDVGFIVTVASMVAICAGAARLAGYSVGSRQTALILAVVALSGPGSSNLINVNVSGVVAALLTWTIILLDEDKEMQAACLFAVGICLKPLIGPGILIFLAVRRYAGFALACVIAIVANVVVLPFLAHPASFFTKTVPSLFRGQTLQPQFNSAIAVVAARHGVPSLVSYALRLAIVALLIWMVWRLRQAPSREKLVAVSTSLVVGFAVIGRTDENHYMLAAVPLVVVLLNSRWAQEKLAGFATLGLLGLPAAVFVGTHIGQAFTMFGQLSLLAGSALVCGRTLAPAEHALPSALVLSEA